MTRVRYDGVAEWYEGFRPALTPDELDVLQRLLGRGSGRCLDVGCGTGLATAAVQRHEPLSVAGLLSHVPRKHAEEIEALVAGKRVGRHVGRVPVSCG